MSCPFDERPLPSCTAVQRHRAPGGIASSILTVRSVTFSALMTGPKSSEGNGSSSSAYGDGVAEPSVTKTGSTWARNSSNKVRCTT